MTMADRTVSVHFSDEELARLEALAQARRTSIDQLIHEAVRQAYLRPTTAERVAAVRRMAELSLPVADPEQMERESAREWPLA